MDASDRDEFLNLNLKHLTARGYEIAFTRAGPNGPIRCAVKTSNGSTVGEASGDDSLVVLMMAAEALLLGGPRRQ